jgi:RNA polymerase sigma-32 factor
MNGNLPSAPNLNPDGNLSRYLQDIRKFPLLEPEEEYMLAKRWKEHEDPEAAARMVNSHLRLVAKIAMGYRGYGLPLGEVISEGNVGLMQAIKRFEPEKGFRLATYAMWWIKASIQEYILRSWSLVKIGTTAAQKKLFFNLRRMKGEMKALEEGDLNQENLQAIATKLDVSEQEVINMNRRMSGPDSSLNAPVRADSEGEWQDWLVDDSDNQETVLADQEEMAERRKNTASRASGSARSKCGLSRNCKKP